jgi:hypothetical protein
MIYENPYPVFQVTKWFREINPAIMSNMRATNPID